MKRIYRTEQTLESYYLLSEEAKNKLVRSLLRTYEAHSAADMVCLGFEYKKHFYYTFIEKVNPKWCRLLRVSSKKIQYGVAKVNIYLTNADKAEILRTHECFEADPSVLRTIPRNRGNSFEKFITEHYTTEKWEKDSTPFYKQGDVNINGKEVQVKLNGAQVVLERTLVNRPWVKA